MAMASAHSDTRAPARWQDYVQLLKPRVMSLVVFTALTGLVCADRPVNPILGAVAILCIAVGAGASGALNMWYDADIDAKMRRTRGRPVPAGKVQGADALALGIVLSLFSVMLMGMALNWLAAGLLAFTIVFYAVVYTNSGIRCRVMPGARMLKMVVMKLIAPRMEEAPARWTARIAQSMAGPV